MEIFDETRVNSKRKRVSKNKKKTWKKHVDITEVEDFLEDQRLQERTGGLVAEKPDANLFYVDKILTDSDTGGSQRRRRELRPLKCHANLLPDPSTKPARVVTNLTSVKRAERKAARVQERSKKLSSVKVTAARQRAEAVQRRKERRAQSLKRRVPAANFDLWEGEPAVKVTKKPAMEIPECARVKIIKVPWSIGKKTSAVASVEVPHPGASYNPTYGDHQDLMLMAHTDVVMKNKAEDKIFRALDAKFPAAHEAPTQATWLTEMSAGLCDDTSLDEDVIDESDLDKLSVNPPVRREDIKTHKQRRKDTETKTEGTKLKKQKAKKKFEKDLLRIKSIKAEIRAEELVYKERARRKTNLRVKYKDKPHKLGKLKYEEPEVALKLSDELQGSLRLLKPEGNLLRDRFKSFQKRNIIEPRDRAKFKRKYKRKVIEKRSHRNPK